VKWTVKDNLKLWRVTCETKLAFVYAEDQLSALSRFHSEFFPGLKTAWTARAVLA